MISWRGIIWLIVMAVIVFSVDIYLGVLAVSMYELRLN